MLLKNRLMLVHADVMLSRAALWWMTAIYWPDFVTHGRSPEGRSWQHIGLIFWLLPKPLPFDALNEEDPFKILGSYLVWENYNGWATIWWRSHGDRLSCVGTIHQRVTDMCDRQPATLPYQMLCQCTASGGNNIFTWTNMRGSQLLQKARAIMEWKSVSCGQLGIWYLVDYGTTSIALNVHVGPVLIEPALEFIDRWCHDNVICRERFQSATTRLLKEYLGTSRRHIKTESFRPCPRSPHLLADC